MSKKKRRDSATGAMPANMTAIESLDYEKLAECIASAIAHKEELKTRQFSATREWMKYFLYFTFYSLSAVSLFMAIVSFRQCISSIKAAFSSSASLLDQTKCAVAFMLAILMGNFCVFSFFAGRELDKEKDRQYIVSLFSSMVSLVALIVALVALVTGVS